MPERILDKLESSRRELLDLGLRNPLLNYRLSKARGLQIVQEKPVYIFDILVNQNKSMSFIGRPTQDENNQQLLIPDLTDKGIADSLTDTKLQTNESDLSLQTRLLNTYYAARTSIEEQGVNILFLTIGMLNWFENENSQEVRKAPLILIPVELERSSARERFKVKYTGEEIGINISLQAKLKTEFVIEIPNLPDIEDLNIENYFNNVEKQIRGRLNWKVDYDSIELGFFSFGKFLLYNDLDNSKWPEEKKPISHPLLIQLFETGFSEPPISADESSFIDVETNADELFQVVDADSSQVLALLAINEGRNLVIQGPPGTGKSQTISNIIANAVGQGKRVLFVAEKMAALEVVKRRLDNIGLGDICLELHSHKANKKDLHLELMRVLYLGKPKVEELRQQVALLKEMKIELNDYCNAINSTIDKSSLSAYQIIGKLINIEKETDSIKLPKMQIQDISEWDVIRFKKAESLADRIEARLKEIGIPELLSFWGTGLTVILPSEVERVKDLIKELSKYAEQLNLTASDVSVVLGLPKITLMREIQMLSDLTSEIYNRPDLTGINVDSNKWLTQQSDINDLISTGKTLKEIRDEYENVFIPEIWQTDVFEIRQNYAQYGNRWYRFLISSYRKNKKQIQGFCKIPLPKENDQCLKHFDSIMKARRLEADLQTLELLASEMFGDSWKKLRSNWHLLELINLFLNKMYQKVEDNIYPSEIFQYLNSLSNKDRQDNYKDKLSEILDLFINIRKRTFDALKFKCGKKFIVDDIEMIELEKQLKLFKEWEESTNEVFKAISWNTLEEVTNEEGFGFLAQTASKWDLAGKHLKQALQKTWFEYLLEKGISSNPSLRRFERSTHEEVIRQFKNIDQLNFHYNRALVAYNHWENMPKPTAGGHVNVLKSEFNKRSRHLPIRKLMQEAGFGIQALKPVFMMSPLSIANFIPPGSLEFDLVVFDEASQVRPVEALGAILRAKQVVVVGDNKQLPPTSFFDTLLKEIEDEENVTADIQSILGMCDAQGVPQRMLRWHYRSKHESLICVSNHEFYDNKLVVFPSPGSRHRLGLIFHHLKDTAYDRGKTRTNPREAEYVADAVLKHVRNSPELTLGVVAFSTAQRQAIQDILELKRRQNPETEEFFRNHPHEPFFVKNLENVQGDERDVIFISIGYGKTIEGYLSMSFGPLNNDGGERRLNVLITRAKLRCEVFTNLSADDIDTSRSNKFGITALKHFLYFAQHGKLNLTTETGKEADSPFEEMVASALEKHGYVVRKQVGSHGFYIDLAVIDSESPGRYLLGIECDGASYHSARSARDRDRLREQVLEGMGWKLHRIWSTDWFKNQDRELKRLIEAIEKAKALLHVQDKDDDDNNITKITLLDRDKYEAEATVTMYQSVKLTFNNTQQDLHLVPSGKLASLIEDIVKVESPVHVEEVYRKIAESYLTFRVGSRIRQALSMAVKFCASNKKIKVKGKFLWHPEMIDPLVRNRGAFLPQNKKITYVSSEEIGLCIMNTVNDAIAIDKDSVLILVARALGFSRVTEDIKGVIEPVLKKLIIEGKLILNGETLRNSI